MVLSTEQGRAILGVKDDVARFFTAANWRELGLLTGCEDVISGHTRLLRSLSFEDSDYPDCVLDVLQRIVRRDPDNLKSITDYVVRTDPNGGETISTAPTKNRKIVFSPSVFHVPDDPVDLTLVAVMMPFAPQFDPVFEAIKTSCDLCNLKCQRAKDIWNASVIMDDVFSLIFRAAIVVCDFSGRNANVFYEAGIAHTLGKQVVPLSQSKDDVPFDLGHHRYLQYLNNGEGLMALKRELFKRLYTLASDADLPEFTGRS